jgi:hypothetical protein
MRMELLKTILWLRWKLTANQFAKTAPWLRWFLVVLAVFALAAMFLVFVGGVALGNAMFEKLPTEVVMLIIDGVMLGFVFFWCIGIVSEIQRSESIDLQRLLHLPVKLKDAFFVNFVASHFSLSLLLLFPAVLGMALGVLATDKIGCVVLLPLVLSCVFAVSSWTYCLRGWLVQLMVNPRRKRSIMILLTVGIIFLAQTPNLFFNVYLRSKHGDDLDKAAIAKLKSEKIRNVFRVAHFYVPPMWVSYGTARAGEGTWWPALGAMTVFSLTGYAGVSRAYRSTLRYYRGDSGGARRAKTRPKAGITPVRNRLDGDLPWVGGDVAVATRAFWQSMLRAPEMKMALLGPVIVALVLGVLFLSRDMSGRVVHAAPLIAIGVTLFSMSGVMQIVFNLFGWDREGFRALVLSPMDRGRILLAKNIALFPFLVGLGLVLYLGVAVVTRMDVIFVIGGIIQILTASLILFMVGNLVSIKLPYRIQLGSLKPTKMPVKNVIVMIALTLLFPFYMIPVVAGPTVGMLAGLVGSRLDVLLNIGISVAMCLFVMVVYALMKKPMGRMLQGSERQILQTVTSELE